MREKYTDHFLVHPPFVKLLRTEKIGWCVDGSRGRTTRYNSHSDSRTSRTTAMRNRGGATPASVEGDGLCFRSEWSLRVSAARSATHRQTNSPDATIETHSDMLIRFENSETTTPARALPSPVVSHSPSEEVVRKTFIAGKTSRNYPTNARRPTHVSCVCFICVCARASRTIRPCPPHGHETI